jgi:hypothetical protein
MKLSLARLIALSVAVLALNAKLAAADTPGPVVFPTSPQAWSQAAQTDVKAAAAITAENHPGFVDPANPRFRTLLTQAERNGLSLAVRVTDAAGYVAAIRRFSNTLQDGHAGAYPTIDNAILPKQKWPGFVAAWRGDALYVYNAAPGGPKRGARITKCDGVPTRTLIQRNVFAFRGRPLEQGNWWVEGRRLFMDNGNPFVALPQRCEFIEEGRRVHRSLTWRETDASFNQWRDDSYNGVTLPVGITKRPSGVVWIAMPTFEPDEAQRASYRSAVAQITAERSTISAAPAIVLDLRDNQGGSSEWSKLIADALWGQTLRNERAQTQRGSNSSKTNWRTSNGNARHVEALVPQLVQMGMADIASELTKIYQGMDAARARGEDFYTEPDDDIAPATNAAQTPPIVQLPPLAAPIFVIVPGQCASSCLNALDVFTLFENVKLIGAPSSADSTYMEVRGQALPSGLAGVVIPNKVYVGRARSAGFVYRPAIQVDDLDWSTEAFERVVLSDIALRANGQATRPRARRQ